VPDPSIRAGAADRLSVLNCHFRPGVPVRCGSPRPAAVSESILMMRG
jgi:hypothetical protein